MSQMERRRMQDVMQLNIYKKTEESKQGTGKQLDN